MSRQLINKNTSQRTPKLEPLNSYEVSFNIVDGFDLQLENVKIVIYGELLETDPNGNVSVILPDDRTYSYKIFYKCYEVLKDEVIVNGSDVQIDHTISIGQIPNKLWARYNANPDTSFGADNWVRFAIIDTTTGQREFQIHPTFPIPDESISEVQYGCNGFAFTETGDKIMYIDYQNDQLIWEIDDPNVRYTGQMVYDKTENALYARWTSRTNASSEGVRKIDVETQNVLWSSGVSISSSAPMMGPSVQLFSNGDVLYSGVERVWRMNKDTGSSTVVFTLPGGANTGYGKSLGVDSNDILYITYGYSSSFNRDWRDIQAYDLNTSTQLWYKRYQPEQDTDASDVFNFSLRPYYDGVLMFHGSSSRHNFPGGLSKFNSSSSTPEWTTPSSNRGIEYSIDHLKNIYARNFSNNITKFDENGVIQWTTTDGNYLDSGKHWSSKYFAHHPSVLPLNLQS